MESHSRCARSRHYTAFSCSTDVFVCSEIFKYQPNRLYVRSILLTEKHARLVHFDRAGIHTTPPINIHQNPATLVRLILGISSTNERLLGLDDSVHWEIVDGQKGRGTLTPRT
jgi:hypothetical protein